MARESELTGIVKPSVDRRSLERNVAQPMSRAFDRVSNITPNLNLRGMGRRLTRMMPGGGMLRRGRGALSGAGGGEGTDIQQAQLAKLDDIHEEIRKGNVSQAGQLTGGGGGGGTNIIPLGGLGRGLGGVGRLAAGLTIPGLGAMGMFEGFKNIGGLENLKRLFGGEFDKGAKIPSFEEFAGTGISMLGGPIGMLFSEEITAALESVDWPELPDLGSLSWPELPQLEGLDWPDLPDLSQQVAWPELPSEIQNLDTTIDWPQPPGWVQQLINALETFGGGDGEPQFRGEDSHMGAEEGINVGPINVDLPGIDEREIERRITQVLEDEFGRFPNFP